MGAGHSAGRRNFDADADADAGAGGEDLLSALPDDVFVSILLKLRDAAAAARTSVLARRWRCLWALVPELAFADGIQHHSIVAALAAHEALDLRDLQVVTREASVEYLAVHRRSPPLWLHAPQGGVARGRGRGPGRAGARTERGHSASLLPASHLRRTRVLVSSPRPAAIRGVRPAPSSHAGRHSRLRPVQPRRRCLLPAVPILKGSLCPECPWTGQLQNPFQVIGNHKYLMEDMTRLPDVEYLTLDVISCGHSFGASSFHVLRMCSRFTILKIRFSCQLQAQTGCSSGCICDQPPNWKTEELRLIWLEDVQILSFAGTEHEVVFLKRLFSWATALKRMMVTFHGSITESKGKELRQLLLSFSRPEICICILPSSAPS